MLKSMHIPFEEHYSRRIRPHDYAYFDYILAMDDSNIEDIQSLVGSDTEHKIYRLLDFTDHPRNIKDRGTPGILTRLTGISLRVVRLF